jgi:small redox-active disulfide protein 2
MMATIQVLGTGCSKCGHLLKNAEEAVSQLNRADSVEKVDDIVKILDFTPSALPALAVDGAVVFAGSLPTVAEICEAIQAATTQESKS